MTTVNKSMKSGDDKVMPFSVVDNSGNAVTVTGGSATYAIANSVDGPALVTKTSAAGAITLSGSTITVTLVPADTASMAGVYYHELEVTDSDGDVFTPACGTMTIERDLIA